MSIASSLSCETGCMALSALTGAKVRCFHQVIYQHEPEDASGNKVVVNAATTSGGDTKDSGIVTSNSRMRKALPTQAMLYVVMTDSELILLDLGAMATNYLSFLYRPVCILVFMYSGTGTVHWYCPLTHVMSCHVISYSVGVRISWYSKTVERRVRNSSRSHPLQCCYQPPPLRYQTK